MENSGGTAMPSGPPVKRSSFASTTEMMIPMPSVAMASACPRSRRIGFPTIQARIATMPVAVIKLRSEGQP
jgi:hypothetical protein